MDILWCLDKSIRENMGQLGGQGFETVNQGIDTVN
jgi:hypothetical protein